MDFAYNIADQQKDCIMSKKIIFKGNPDGCYLPFEPGLLQLDLQESSEEPNKIEQLAKLSVKETKDFCFDLFTENDWIELCLMNSSFDLLNLRDLSISLTLELHVLLLLICFQLSESCNSFC